MLETYFDDTIMALWERPTSVFVHKKFLYKPDKEICEIMLEDLWSMATEESNGVEELYFNYFFLVMGITNPYVGLFELSRISYNLEKTTNLVLSSLENYLSLKPDLYNVNYDHLLQKYMEGILREAIFRLEVDNAKDKAEANKVDLVLDLLRAKKA